MKIKILITLIQLLFVSIFYSYAQVNIASRGTTYTQNFDVLSSVGAFQAWTNNSTITGWYSSQTNYNAGTGSSNSGGLYSFGVSGAHADSERALGSLVSGTTGIIYYGVRIVNNTCNDLTSFDLSYIGEQWRNASNASIQKLDFQYKIGATDITSGTWTDFDALDFSSPQVSGTPNSLDGNVAANRTLLSAILSSITLLPGQELWLRWKDADDAGNDHGLAIDDFSVTANGAACHYKTQTSGEWNATSTWEQSDDNFNWSPASSAPTYLNGAITIENTHTVIITSNITVDQLTIKEGATILYADFPDSITINNGTGPDFIVEGTFYDMGPKSISWNNSSTWKMGSNGTLIRTRSTSANAWRDNYDGGISNIPSTANWIIRKVSSDNPSLTGTSMTYPNLTIENMSTSPWTAGIGSIFTGSSSSPIIKGSFDIGGTGTNTVSFLNQNENINPVQIEGNLIVRPLCILRNFGTGFEIKGNLTVDGNLKYGESKPRKIVFSGTSQAINGTGVIGAHEVQVKSGAELTLNTNLTIDSLLDVSGAVITTSDHALLTIGSEAGIVFSNSAYVNGPMRYTGLNAFTFPVGKSGYQRPLSISSSVSGTVDFTCEYFLSNPQTEFNNVVDPALHHISACEYWLLTRNSGSESKNVTLSWDATSCGITDPADLRIAHWDEMGEIWYNEGNTAFTGDNSGGTLTSELMDNFSPITLASSTPVNPLPVVWLDFTGLFREKEVELKWRTGAEVNSSHFVAERSKDGINFFSIGTLPASGNSTTIKQYSLTDNDPISGISFYRIKQVDNNGAISYSKIISGSRMQMDALSIEIISLDGDMINVQITGSNTTPALFEVMDMLGKKIVSEKVTCENNKKIISVPASFMSQGVYFVKLSNSVNQDIKKFLK